MAAMTKTPPFMPRPRPLLAGQAEGPVQAAGGSGAVQGDADDDVPLLARLEQQALARGAGVAGLDADRARIAGEERVEVLPQVGVVPGAGREPVAARAHDRAEGRERHGGA